jgi:hypothetical protein
MMSKLSENKRQSIDKLDGIVVPLIAFAASIVANTVTGQQDIFGRLSIIFFLLAVFAHYLSIEAEARVLMSNNSVPNRLSNRLTGIFNNVRLVTLSAGFILLIIGIIRSF